MSELQFTGDEKAEKLEEKGCISVNEPPLPMKPIRLAGTMKQYSTNASPHDSKIIR
jgi:hypothetical protein